MLRYKQNNIFKRFLFSNIFILFIPLIIGIIAYNAALKVVVKDTRDINMLTLEQASGIIDQRLKEVDGLVTLLSTSRKTADIANITDPYEVGAVQKIFDLKELLSIYSVTNNFISNLYVHSTENDMIISPYATNTQGHSFYGSFFKYGDMSVDEWYKKILNAYHLKEFLPVANVSTGANQAPMLIYIQSIPVSSSYQTKGAVLVLIDPNQLNQYLESLNIQDGGWAYITDAKGNLITMLSSDNSTPTRFDLDNKEGYTEELQEGKRMIVVHKTSPSNGWHYVSVQPYKVAMNKVEYIKRIIYIIIAISLLFSLLAAFYLAYRNSKPIREIIQTIHARLGQEPRKTSSDYEYLNNSITTLISDNDQLKEKVEKQLPYLRAMLYERLLSSGFSSFDELGALLVHVGIDTESVRKKKTLSCIAWINTYHGQINNEILQELDIVKATFKDCFTRLTEDKAYMLDTDFDKIAIIIAFEKDNEPFYKEYMERIWNEVNNTLSERYNITSFLACGSMKESLLEAGISFEEAKRALDHKSQDGDVRLVWYSDCPTDSKGYYYSMEVEMRLVSSVRSGELEVVEKILADIYNENFIVRTLSSEMLRHLLYDMKGTIIKLTDQMRLTIESNSPKNRKRLEDTDSNTPLEEVYTLIKQTFLTMCSFVVQEKQSSDTQLKEQLTEYIKNKYSDPQLSLKGTADAFCMTEAFLSQFFKVHIKLCFSDYVENLRMEKACALLSKTELNINDVAEKLGYNSPHSFRRAFKRVKGVSPAVYRDSI